jgi:pimeloyl-ACP methyl ester carboxylesterase
MATTETPSKPLIVLVHGAWHRPTHYLRLISHLRDLGYDVVAPALPTTGFKSMVARKSVPDDVEAIQQALAAPLEAGRDVVVVAHSYGGIPATDAVMGRTVHERRGQGLHGGVKCIIYMAAFAPPARGLSLFDMIGLKTAAEHPDWWNIEVCGTLLGFRPAPNPSLHVHANSG